MKELKKTNLKDFKRSWTSCVQCAGCYYNGPIVPHNWRELPPPEWSSPLNRCPSYDYFKFRAYTAPGRGNLAALIFDDEQLPVTELRHGLRDSVKSILRLTSHLAETVARTVKQGS